MKRREMMLATGAALVGLGRFPLGYAAAPDGKKRRLLVFTRSAGFQHSVITRKDGALGHAESILVELGKKHGFEAVCTKDGTVFDSDEFDSFDGYFFYTSGDLTNEESRDGAKPMSQAGKERLLKAIHGGKGFVGSHCASDTFHTAGERRENQSHPDPYIGMIGGEFISHGRQQTARMTVIDLAFPGAAKGGSSFDLHEEWYALKNFAPDLHVILRNETKGMEGRDYQRPPFPATWARMHGRGRVFYTSMGHREDVWTNEIFQSIVLGGLAWSFGNIDADVSPNLKTATPEAYVLET